MPYGNALPLTGGAGALVLGHYLGLDDIIAAAITVVLFGITTFRYGSRIGRARTTIFIAVATAGCAVAFLAHVGKVSWPLSIAAGLTTAMAALYLSARVVPRDRRAVA